MESNSNNAIIDKSRFVREMTALAVRVPVKEISEFQSRFGDLALLIPKVKPVRKIEDDEKHKMLLMQSKSEDMQKFIDQRKYKVDPNYRVELTYENLTMSEVLKELIPEEAGEVPSGFETVGDIAHFNLPEKMLKYKQLIGQVTLDKNPHLRTAVTKLGQIETTFRYYDLECMAGDASSYETVVIEDKVRFKVDISKVYWCSKLHTERLRMVEQVLKKGEVLCDMFCGIGPLALKAAVKKNVKVVANDLNPACFEYLEKNIALNKMAKLVLPFNMDAREFVRMVVKASNDPAQDKIPEEFMRFDHVYMNLPVDAVEFLDAFIGLFNSANKNVWKDPNSPEKLKLPMIHVYGFTFEDEKQKALDYFVDRIGKAMQFPAFSADQVVHFHNIRDVSPQSHMYATSFKLPEEVAFRNVE